MEGSRRDVAFCVYSYRRMSTPLSHVRVSVRKDATPGDCDGFNAFDTNDPGIELSCLEVTHGIGNVLAPGVASFRTPCLQRVLGVDTIASCENGMQRPSGCLPPITNHLSRLTPREALRRYFPLTSAVPGRVNSEYLSSARWLRRSSRVRAGY